MKKIIVLLFVSVPFLVFSQTTFTIKANTILNYSVKSINGKEYDFIVTVKKFSAGGIKFEWKMSATQSGTVTIYKSALENATTYKNYFGNNTNEKLTKESTVWLSKKNFKELTNNKSTEMSLDFSIQNYLLETKQKIAILKNKKTINLSVKSVTSKSSSNNMLILDDATNPLIVKMQVKDFTITLKSIEEK